MAALSYWVLFPRLADRATKLPAEVAAASAADAKDTARNATRAQATLTIVPRVVVATMAESFTLTITASGVSEMSSAGAQINYDASLLQFESLAGGGILASSGEQVVLAHRDDPDAGLLKISAQRLSQALPGDSAVLTLVFHPRTRGAGRILIIFGARDGQGHSIAVPEGHAEVTIQ
jgi:hypothetical protein